MNTHRSNPTFDADPRQAGPVSPYDRLHSQADFCVSSNQPWRSPIRRTTGLHWFDENVDRWIKLDPFVQNRWGASPGAGGNSPKAEPSVTGGAQATGKGIGERSG